MTAGTCNTESFWDDTPNWRELFGLSTHGGHRWRVVVELCDTSGRVHSHWISCPEWVRADRPTFPTREVRLLWLAAEHGRLGPGRYQDFCTKRLAAKLPRLQSVLLLGPSLALNDDLVPRWPLGRVLAELGMGAARWAAVPW